MLAQSSIGKWGQSRGAIFNYTFGGQIYQEPFNEFIASPIDFSIVTSMRKFVVECSMSPDCLLFSLVLFIPFGAAPDTYLQLCLTVDIDIENTSGQKTLFVTVNSGKIQQ